jgi:signal transduction histidine kinase
LALLRTELDLALRRQRSRPELEATLASASIEVDRLISLANHLLVLARQSETGLPVTPEIIPVADLFGCAARYVETTGHRTMVVEPLEVTAIWADRARLRQALENLVDNAFRHGLGTVGLSTVRSGGWVEVHVTDEGPGFSSDVDRAFDRFTHGRDSHGAGLGLAIVAQVAEAHGGAAGVRHRDGGGADVWIRLPHPDAWPAGDDATPKTADRVSGQSSR